LEKQLHNVSHGISNPAGPQHQHQQQLQQLQQQQQQQQQGPRTKSFDNPSASSTASSGVGTSISSLNATNTNLAGLNSNTSAPATPNVVKKYYEQKYGSTTNMNVTGMGGGGATGSGGSNSPIASQSNILNDKLNQPRNGAPRNSTTAAFQNSNQIPFVNAPNNPMMNNNPMNNNNNANPLINSNFNSSNSSLNQNQNFSTNVGAGLSSLTSQFTSGIANLKLTASNFQANKLTSKFMNPFSS
jgi:hypothetical protein